MEKGNFLSPSEFLKYIQSKHNNKAYEKDQRLLLDEFLDKLTVKNSNDRIRMFPYQRSLMELIQCVMLTDADFYLDGDSVMRMYSLVILDSFSKNQKSRIFNSVAFGVTTTLKKEGFITKSNGLSYALIISTGLYDFISGAIKFSLAINAPNLFSSPSVTHLKEDFYNILKKYNNLEKGSTILINSLTLKNENKHELVIPLFLFILFIICHELGHFCNNDLSKKSNLLLLNGYDNVSVLKSNMNHLMEYKADLFACNLMKRIIDKNTYIPPEEFMRYYFTFFNILDIIQPHSCYSHPSPIKRFLNISANYLSGYSSYQLLLSGFCDSYKDHPDYKEYEEYYKKNESLRRYRSKKYLFAKEKSTLRI